MFGSKVNKLGASKQNLFEPDRLFRDSEEGIYNDITTWPTSYFEDTAGTDAAELEDTVALILDQSGNGNDWSQATAGARGKVSARYNLLERTEEFNDAYWVKSGDIVITPNAAEAPDGTMTADRVQFTLAGEGRAFRQAPLFTEGTQLIYSFYAKAVSGSGTLAISTNFAGFDISQTVNDTSWTKLTLNITSGGTNFAVYAGADHRFHVGEITDFYIWGADLRLASDTDQPAYQRVTTATDYDTVGFDPYLLMNRVDDNYAATLAAGTYTVAIGTRQGIWIDTVEHAGGTFTFGPTTYTGGPTGLFSIIGDKFISPPTLVDRALTTSEKNALVQWYQARGAGALYVLGEELVVNGTFDTDVSGWTAIRDASISYSAGRLELVSGSTTFPTTNQDISSGLTEGKGYILKFTITAPELRSARIFIGNNIAGSAYSTIYFVAAGTTQTTSAAFVASADAASGGHVNMGVSTGAVLGDTVYFDNISVRELTQPGA